MRRPFVAGNWKMNLNRRESLDLVQSLVLKAPANSPADIAVCPPFVYVDAVVQVAHNSHIKVGAQNLYFESSGAYTGEVSGPMVKDIGCDYVILGHSERRAIFGESDEQVNKKLHAALANDLTPIVCVGELLEEREAGKTLDVIKSQFQGSLAGLDTASASRLVIAYEPVWAIGTGKVATPDQAEEVHASLRAMLAETFGADVADAVRIQYGGSVKPDNASDLMSQPNIDGALVGGAALKADSFLAIIEAAAAQCNA